MIMFERFRRQSDAEHLRVKRNGKRLGYLCITTNLKDGKLSFNVRTRGSFEQFENDKVVAEILRMREWLKDEMKDNPDIYFFDNSKKNA